MPHEHSIPSAPPGPVSCAMASGYWWLARPDQRWALHVHACWRLSHAWSCSQMPRPNESTPVGMCAELSQNRLKVAGGTVKQLQKPCKEPVLCLRLFFLFASMILSPPRRSLGCTKLGPMRATRSCTNRLPLRGESAAKCSDSVDRPNKRRHTLMR